MSYSANTVLSRSVADVNMGKRKRKDKSAAKLAKAKFTEMVAELSHIRGAVQKVLLRLLNLTWPGAISTLMVAQPPRVEDSIQRFTEGLKAPKFREEMMRVLYRFVWDICKMMEDSNAVLFQRLVLLQDSLLALDTKHFDVGLVQSKLPDINFSYSILHTLEQDFDSKFKLSPFQQALLDEAGEDLEFGPFAQRCIDLALRKDERMFISVESTRVFLEALQIAAVSSKLSELRQEVHTSLGNVSELKAACVEALGECTYIGE
jgi:hypothetical protein